MTLILLVQSHHTTRYHDMSSNDSRFTLTCRCRNPFNFNAKPIIVGSFNPSHSSMRDSTPEISTLTIFAIAFLFVDGRSSDTRSIKNVSCLSSSVPRSLICFHAKSFPSLFAWVYASTAARPKRFQSLKHHRLQEPT